jgi:hypothetical protein
MGRAGVAPVRCGPARSQRGPRNATVPTRAEAGADENNDKAIATDVMMRDMVASDEPIARRLVACRANAVHDRAMEAANIPIARPANFTPSSL